MGLLAQLQGGHDTSLEQPGEVSSTPWGFWEISVVKLQKFGEKKREAWNFSGSHDLEVAGVFSGVTPAECAHPFPLFKSHLAAACGRTLSFCCPGSDILS